MHQLLLSQRFDVLVLNVRDEQDGCEIAEVLDGLKLPLHTILLGSASTLPVTLQRRRNGTLRYVPGRLPAHELSQLVDASISAGAWEECATENDACGRLQEVELEEAIDRAASAVYDRANRKRQRFTTVVEGPVGHVLGDPAKLRQTLTTLLRLVVSIAPRGDIIAVEARAGKEEWLIRIRASDGNSTRSERAQIADALREEAKTLTAAARDVHDQGGMLWAELLGPGAPALCLTLPLPPEASARPAALEASRTPAASERR